MEGSKPLILALNLRPSPHVVEATPVPPRDIGWGEWRRDIEEQVPDDVMGV